MTISGLMKFKNIAECPLEHLQYFWQAFSDNWSWVPIFSL